MGAMHHEAPQVAPEAADNLCVTLHIDLIAAW